MSGQAIKIEGGKMSFVYDDGLAEALGVTPGAGEVCRVSHVEPHPRGGGWLADMRPVGGPVIGNGWVRTPEAMQWSVEHEGSDGVASLPPFPSREAALAAERRWLREHLGL